MTAIVHDIEKVLFLRKFGVPFGALSHVFGRDHMYWYRIEQSLGRNSVVGKTIRNPDDIPLHLSADEKHTWILGEKTYIATTVGGQCILSASIAKNAREDGLQDAYQVFFTFRPRKATSKERQVFTGFNPAISQKSLKRISTTIRKWKLQHWSGRSINDIAEGAVYSGYSHT